MLVASALIGGNPAQSKTGRVSKPPAPAMDEIKPAAKATTVSVVINRGDSSINYVYSYIITQLIILTLVLFQHVQNIIGKKQRTP